jgi:hypothetical protein
MTTVSDAPLRTDEVIAVDTFLRDGDLIAVPTGNMVTLYRVRHDEVKGETDFEYEGIAAMTGAHHMVRRTLR